MKSKLINFIAAMGIPVAALPRKGQVVQGFAAAAA